VVPQRVLEIGAAALLLLALLGLLISLLAAAREATTRDTVLSALGMTWRQRATLACILHIAVTLPAGILGAGLGLLLSRLLVPVFVLSPQATEPQPPPVVLFAAGWPTAAAVVLVGLTALAAFAASARRRDPSATSRLGGSA
jgi:ABC-type antimicrobial peptide transport system permease subunit